MLSRVFVMTRKSHHRRIANLGGSRMQGYPRRQLKENRTMTAMWHGATCPTIQETVVSSLGRGLQRAICPGMHPALVMYVRHVHLLLSRLPKYELVVSLSKFAILHEQADRRRRLNFDANHVLSLPFRTTLSKRKFPRSVLSDALTSKSSAQSQRLISLSSDEQTVPRRSLRGNKQRSTHRSQLTIDSLKLSCVASVCSLTLEDYVSTVDPS